MWIGAGAAAGAISGPDGGRTPMTPRGLSPRAFLRRAIRPRSLPIGQLAKIDFTKTRSPGTSEGMVMSSPVMSCHFVSCHVLSCHVVSCPVLSCHVVSCFLSCRLLSCPVMSSRGMSSPVMSCLFVSCPVMSSPEAAILCVTQCSSRGSLFMRARAFSLG